MTPHPDLSSLESPPRPATAPAVLVGIGVAVLGSFLWVAGLGGGSQANLLHPLACVGHGLSAAMLVLLAGSWRQMRRCSDDLKRTGDLLGQARDGRSSNGETLAPEDLELHYRARAHAWSESLERRWRWYFALAAAPVVPGLIVGLFSLYADALPLPPYRDVFVPLMVATMETLVVCLAAVWLRLGWDHLLHDWPRRAAAGMERPVSARPALQADGKIPSGDVVTVAPLSPDPYATVATAKGGRVLAPAPRPVLPPPPPPPPVESIPAVNEPLSGDEFYGEEP